MALNPPPPSASGTTYTASGQSIGQTFLLVLSGLCIMAAAISIDSILPSFPAISHSFALQGDQVRLTIPLFFIGLGLGQLVWGVAADSFGRKPMLLLGFGVYAVASMIGSLAPSFELLLLARFVQGLSAAAGYLLGRTILRDCFSGAKLAWAMAMASSAFAFGPMVAPGLGWALTHAFGWRSVFAITAVYCLLVFWMVFKGLPETLPVKRPISPGRIADGMRQVYSHPQSLLFLVIACLGIVQLVGALSGAALIFTQQLGTSELVFAICFAACGVAVLVGQQTNSRLIKRLGPERTTLVGGVMAFTTGLSFFAAGTFITPGIVMVTGLFFAFFFGYHMVFSNAASLYLDPHGNVAGLAGSIFGLTTLGVGASLSILLSDRLGSSLAGYGLTLMATALACLGLSLLWLLVLAPRFPSLEH